MRNDPKVNLFDTALKPEIDPIVARYYGRNKKDKNMDQFERSLFDY